MALFVTADIPAYACADSLLDCCWREAVRDEDVVYVIAVETGQSVLPRLDTLPGTIRLVPSLLVLDGGFLLSPVPLHPGQLAPGQINLHGRPLRPLPPEPSRLCVSIDETGFRPLLLADARLRAHGERMGRPALRLVAPGDPREARRDPRSA